MIDKIHGMVLNIRRAKLREIVQTTGVLKGAVALILRDKLGMKKIFSRWVTWLLSAENKYNHVVTPKALFACMLHNPNEFLGSFVTINKA